MDAAAANRVTESPSRALSFPADCADRWSIKGIHNHIGTGRLKSVRSLALSLCLCQFRCAISAIQSYWSTMDRLMAHPPPQLLRYAESCSSCSSNGLFVIYGNCLLNIHGQVRLGRPFMAWQRIPGRFGRYFSFLLYHFTFFAATNRKYSNSNGHEQNKYNLFAQQYGKYNKQEYISQMFVVAEMKRTMRLNLVPATCPSSCIVRLCPRMFRKILALEKTNIFILLNVKQRQSFFNLKLFVKIGFYS